LSKIEHIKEKTGRANGFLPSFSGPNAFFLKVVAFFFKIFYGIPVAVGGRYLTDARMGVI
jgi:hypothetical protein